MGDGGVWRRCFRWKGVCEAGCRGVILNIIDEYASDFTMAAHRGTDGEGF